MAQFRPAGFSDDETDSDEEYAFFEKPTRKYMIEQPSQRRQTEINFQNAIINGSLEEVENIVSSELNNEVNLMLDSGWTPLMHACFHAQDKIVKFLLEKGADPNYHADSVTPLMTACSNTSADKDTVFSIVCDLLKRDCLLNIGDKYGQTALMRAIGSGRLSVVQKLMELDVNIEMRDQQGWTAVFWAVHHNQLEILQLLIGKGARLSEVDLMGRRPLEIAETHDYQHIVDVLKLHLNIKDEEEEDTYNSGLVTWFNFYPGIEKGDRPTYKNEIPNLLYGMNCDRLKATIMNSDMELRTFLLMEERDMDKLGIDMPYERQRLKIGLRNFHKRGWKLNAVSGLYARSAYNDFSILDCLTSLGTHLQQIYIIEATLQYTLREYNRVQNQIKSEPPDAPVVIKLKEVSKKLLTNINSIRREMKIMKAVLKKIVKNNPEPADLIKDKTTYDIVMEYVPETVFVISLGFLLKNVVVNYLKK